MKPCLYCDWNDDHPYHYPDCPGLEIDRLTAELEKERERVKEVEEENNRLVPEWQQCHEQNSRLVSERLSLQSRLSAMEKVVEAVFCWPDDIFISPGMKDAYCAKLRAALDAAKVNYASPSPQ